MPDDVGVVVAVHRAVVEGDLDALRQALGDPPGFPDCSTPLAIGNLLVYAVYHGPRTLVRALLDEGADADPPVLDGFPPVVALFTTGRPDRREVLALLVERGADVDARDANDATALHRAVGAGDVEAVRLLLAAGADPHVRTRIDDHESPLDAARRAGRDDLVLLLLTGVDVQP